MHKLVIFSWLKFHYLLNKIALHTPYAVDVLTSVLSWALFVSSSHLRLTQQPLSFLCILCSHLTLPIFFPQGVIDGKCSVSVPIQVIGQSLGPLLTAFGVFVVGSTSEPLVCFLCSNCLWTLDFPQLLFCLWLNGIDWRCVTPRLVI